MDNAAKWFLAGIVVSLVNTALVLAFLGIPGITDRGDDDVRVVEVEGLLAALAETDGKTTAVMTDAGAGMAPAPPVTYVLVQDEEGNVIVQRTELAQTGAEASAASGTLQLAEPRFSEVAHPAFMSAHDAVAWVTSRGQFELWRVDLEGRVQGESLDGIDDLGDSTVLDVDVTGDGTLYVLIHDGMFDWRLFRRVTGASWQLIASTELSGWPAAVTALSVADGGNVYVSASQPAGLFRIDPPFVRVGDWVPGVGALGIDTAADDSLQLYAAPQGAPAVPTEQIGYYRGGRFGSWQSQYQSCGEATSDGGESADRPVPQFPRDVAIVDAVTALVVDSLNHVIRLQHEGGAGEVVFGVPCEQGGDGRHLLSPGGATIDEHGNVFISDSGNNRVVVLARRSEPEVAAVVTTVAAEIDFGLPEACPGERCDAADRLRPFGVRVPAGETVRFNINDVSRQVAIYGPGARVGNIDTAIVGGLAGTPGAQRIIMDPNGRVGASPVLPFGTPAAPTWEWDTTGAVPGTYLVICTFQPHFDSGMYGWVIVE